MEKELFNMVIIIFIISFIFCLFSYLFIFRSFFNIQRIINEIDKHLMNKDEFCLFIDKYKKIPLSKFSLLSELSQYTMEWYFNVKIKNLDSLSMFLSCIEYSSLDSKRKNLLNTIFREIFTRTKKPDFLSQLYFDFLFKRTGGEKFELVGPFVLAIVNYHYSVNDKEIFNKEVVDRLESLINSGELELYGERSILLKAELIGFKRIFT